MVSYRAVIASAVLAAVAGALARATAVAVVDEGEDGGLHGVECGLSEIEIGEFGKLIVGCWLECLTVVISM